MQQKYYDTKKHEEGAKKHEGFANILWGMGWGVQNPVSIFKLFLPIILLL
jgi:hypothetical protein